MMILDDQQERQGFPHIRVNEKLLTFLVALVAVTFFLIILWLKFDGYRAWRYFSDLFSFYSVLRESSRGFIGLDFVYGNAFGDHAYWFLLLMTPLYPVFKTQTIYFLLGAAPAAYLIAALLLHFTLRKYTHPLTAFMLALTFIIGYHFTFRGLFEEVFGMHPEIVSGYVLIIGTCLLLLRTQANTDVRYVKMYDGLIFLTFVLYGLLKEEMALLLVVYWGVMFILTRRRSAALWLGSSAALVIIDFILIGYFRTPYNRTNELLLADFLESIQNRSLLGTLFFHTTSGRFEWPFWLTLVGTAFVMGLIFWRCRSLQPPVMALYVSAVVKMIFGLMVTDFNLISWHNFAAVMMGFAAILLAIAQLPRSGKKIGFYGAAIMLTVSIFTFYSYDLGYIRWNIAKNVDSRYRIAIFSDDFNAIRSQIDPMRVTAIHYFSARSWINYRNVYYPHRENVSPFELADYIVLPLGEAEKFWRVDALPFTEKDIPPTFQETDRNAHFVLYQRVAITEQERAMRAYFAKYNLPQELLPLPAE